MGIWNTKFRKPALIASALAITLAANPVFARDSDTGSKKGGAGFASGAVIGGATAGPIGAVIGAGVGAIVGERAHKKSEALKAARKAETDKLAADIENLNLSLAGIEGKAGQMGSTVQFRTGQTAVRDSDRARLQKMGTLVADLKDVRVRVSGFADSRGGDALNQSLSQERAEMVARELEKQVTQALLAALPDADVAALLAWRNDPHAAAEREALLGAYRAEVKAGGAVAIRTMVRGWPRS